MGDGLLYISHGVFTCVVFIRFFSVSAVAFSIAGKELQDGFS
jgi:hypothetical protein